MDDPGSEPRPLQGRSSSVYAAFTGNLVIALMKFVVGFLVGSSAMMAEGFHSLADTGNQVLLMVGLYTSQRPADMQHPFGYGKDHYFWGFLVAVTMFTIGAVFSIYEGLDTILHPQPMQHVAWAYVVLAVAVVLEGFALRVALKEFQESKFSALGLLRGVRALKSSTTMTVIFEDSAALTGIAIAATGIFLSQWLHNRIYDGLASILIGLMLVLVAYVLAIENRGLLIGEAASKDDRRKIIEVVEAMPGVQRVLNLLTMHIGPDEILVNLEVKFTDDLTTAELEAAIDRIEYHIQEAVPLVSKIFIEVDSVKSHLRDALRSGERV